MDHDYHDDHFQTTELQFPLLGQGPGQRTRARSATSGRLMRQAAGAASGDGIHKELFRCMPNKPALPTRLTHDDILQGNQLNY